MAFVCYRQFTINLMFRRTKQAKPLAATYIEGNEAKLIRGGREYFDLLEKMILSAKRSIYFQVYIFEEDDTGKRIADALIIASQRGVKVYLLVDGYASKNLSTNFIDNLTGAGINFRRFEPILKSKNFYFGRRLHLKVIVTDVSYGLVGGLNISDRYNDTTEAIAWLDWALFVRGEVADSLARVSLRRFKAGLRVAPIAIESTPFLLTGAEHDCPVRVRINDWVSRKREISLSYLEMFKTATSDIIIMSPYFLPGYEFRKRMRLASKRGVKIRVILAGISDIALSKYAERFLYRWLLRNKIEIYEYQKTVVHGKIAVCDGKWMTVGSYNMNNLSAYASIELNLDVANEALAGDAGRRLLSMTETECQQITEEVYQHSTGWIERVLQRSAYNLLRMILFAFTFYFRQKE